MGRGEWAGLTGMDGRIAVKGAKATADLGELIGFVCPSSEPAAGPRDPQHPLARPAQCRFPVYNLIWMSLRALDMSWKGGANITPSMKVLAMLGTRHVEKVPAKNAGASDEEAGGLSRGHAGPVQSDDS